MENSTVREVAVSGPEGIFLNCSKAGRHSFIFILIPAVYGCNFVVGVIGNSMVVAVIYRYMKLKTVANVFVLNLAVSDLTFLATLPMWATFTASGYQWPFGGFLCKAAAGLVMFNLYSSIFFLTALSIDRYLAIVHPMRSRQCRTVLYARITCVLVWLAALLLSVPTALTRDTMLITNHNITTCGILHPEDSRPLLLTISLMKTILGFLVPFLIIITCYFLIGRALVGAQSFQKNESSRSRDDEVLRMLAAAVLAFFLCWMPHQVFHFIELLGMLKIVKNCDIVDVIDTAMPFTICIAFLNSCVNPILYGFVGQNFRKNLFQLLRCAPAGPARPHPSISSKMSTLSYRASEVLRLSNKNKAVMANRSVIVDVK
ncbi:type-1 angiotensin II receptor [Esox lucius]|uniref:Type-1 angiotensin II receptor n=1 Tax=Esox lucius TaxID=8010 RepID=A0A3P8XDG9_ESOLU|nr:type-1 angiotensin II receptor [Esox lucius]XP_012986753.1 type-1 angiotensin II receptor [Esox lucius]